MEAQDRLLHQDRRIKLDHSRTGDHKEVRDGTSGSAAG
jgi:hypothetical protein